VHAAQTGEQGVLQVQVDLRSGAEHLQAADLRIERGDRLGQQGLIIVAGADNDLLGLKLPAVLCKRPGSTSRTSVEK
jgi:hypothetical protein